VIAASAPAGIDSRARIGLGTATTTEGAPNLPLGRIQMQPTKIDKDAVHRDWAGQGFSCEVWVDPPGQIWPDVLHDVDQMVLLLEGDCVVELHERTIRMMPGDELLLPAGERHTVRNRGNGPARWLHGYRSPGA
jgi:mannose-6-phosphate isomerase-like protein (cupin superfamily)